jgi:hypothetical protein
LAKFELDGNLPLAVQSPESKFSRRREFMADQEFDVFLSYATEADREWAQNSFIERLRSSGVRSEWS